MKKKKEEIHKFIADLQKYYSGDSLATEITDFIVNGKQNYKHPVIKDIEFCMKVSDIQKQTKNRQIIEYRYLAIFILKNTTNFTLKMMKDMFDGIGTSTMKRGIDKIEFMITQKDCNPLYIFLVEKYNITFVKYTSNKRKYEIN